MNADFTHLHVHTQYSLLDSAIRLDDLFKSAINDKMEAIAMTDHGQLFGAVDFYLKAKLYGIHPILGSELYMAPGSRLIKEAQFGSGDDELAPYATSRSGRYHLVLLCMNQIGYHNLCRLITASYFEGFYYKPRIDKEILGRYSEGLIATSACLKGEIASLCLQGDMDRAEGAVRWYQKIFQDRFYLEIEENGLPQQMLVNQRFLELSEKLNVPLIATADCHYLKKSDAISHEVLMAIQTGKTIEIANHQPPSDEFYFKPQEVMKSEFKFSPSAISNTMEIAKRCQFEFKFEDESGKKIYHFPHIDPPKEKSLETFLAEKALDGLRKRLKELEIRIQHQLSQDEISKYENRLDRELKVINEMGFAGYFLIVADFIQYAKDQLIPVGPGRGSGAGSLVAYALRITELDPLEHGLLFERFLNPERVSLPDFDIDFCMDRRDEIIRYVSDKYGKDSVAQIITYGKLQPRGVIRDVGRVFGMSAQEVDKIAKLIPETLQITIVDALSQDVRLKKTVESDPKLTQLFKMGESLEGLYRHSSIHAAGLVISDKSLVEHCPLYRGKNGEVVVQYDMNSVEKIGLIKFDFLGLKTLTFLQKTEKLIHARHPSSNPFNLNDLSLKDKAMYQLLGAGDTLGVFQLESSGMQDLLRKITPDCFEDIVAINALYRPGPIESGMVDDFIARKHGRVPIEYDFDELKPILQETYGVVVYQEQVQQIAIRLASYTAGGADLLRRAMGKKKPEEMAKQKKTFIEGALKNGFDKNKVEKCFDLMEKFAGYGFNKSHAAAYALIACQTAFLKKHYPVEFYAALLSTEMDNTDKITKYITDSKKHSIAILPPDINESDTDFTVLSDTQIRFGLGAIKGVGQIAIDAILDSRKKGGSFKDLYDLTSRTLSRIVNKKVLEALIKSGALDGFGMNRATLFSSVDVSLDSGHSIQKLMDDKQPSFADLLQNQDESFTRRKITYVEEKSWPRLLELKYEKETIGFFVTGHPLDDFQHEMSAYTTIRISDCLRQGSSAECMLGAQVVNLKEILTKRGERMAFVTLEDQEDQLEAIIFSDVYEEAEIILKSQEPIWLKGQLEVADGHHKILMSKKSHAKVLPLRYAYEALAKEIHVFLRASQGEQTRFDEFLGSFHAYLRRHSFKEGAPVYVHVETAPRVTSLLRMKEVLPIHRDWIEQVSILIGGKGRVEFR